MKEIKADFGAIGDGVADDTAAFILAVENGGCFISNGTYKLSNLAILSRVEFTGEHRDKTIITGDGNLILLPNADSGLVLKNLTIQNQNVRGDLVKKTYLGHTNESVFSNVHFKKAAYHINTFTEAQWSIVNWRFTDCRFIDASQISRMHGSVWASTERDCYTWYCKNGLVVYGYVANFGVKDSVFELNGQRAIIVITFAGLEVNGLALESLHFEANGQEIAMPDIYFGSVTTPTPFKKVSIRDCNVFAPKHAKQLQVINTASMDLTMQSSNLNS